MEAGSRGANCTRRRRKEEDERIVVALKKATSEEFQGIDLDGSINSTRGAQSNSNRIKSNEIRTLEGIKRAGGTTT